MLDVCPALRKELVIMKHTNIFDKTLEYATFLSFFALVIVVAIQVVTRFLPITFIWTVVLSRFLFIYSVSFGAPLAIKRNEFVNVDFLINWLPEKARLAYETIMYLIIMFFTLLIGIEGISYIQIGAMQQSRALPIPMSVPYASISISAFLMFIYSGVYIFDLIKNRNEREGDQ